MSSFEIVRNALCTQLHCKVDDVTKNADFRHDLGADSLDLMELVVKLEKEYNSSIPDDIIMSAKTVKDLIVIVDRTVSGEFL